MDASDSTPLRDLDLTDRSQWKLLVPEDKFTRDLRDTTKHCASVFLLLDPKNGKMRCIKEIKTGITSKVPTIAAGMNEYVLTKECEHKHIIRVGQYQILPSPYASEIPKTHFHAERFYYEMEYLPQNDIVTMIDNTGISVRQCFVYFAQLVSAVQWMHSKNIAHRDIKPENILVRSKRKSIVLCDFGSAIYCPYGSATGLCGTKAYLPPDASPPNYKLYNPFKLDVWSVGVTLGVMMLGDVLWENTIDCDHFMLYAEKGKLSNELISHIIVGHEKCHRLDVATIIQKAEEETQLYNLLKNKTKFRHFLETVLNLDPDLRPDINTIANSSFAHAKTVEDYTEEFIESDSDVNFDDI